MTVFLPKDLVDVDDFIAQITDENYAAWLAVFEEKNVELYLPKFKFKYKITKTLRSFTAYLIYKLGLVVLNLRF